MVIGVVKWTRRRLPIRFSNSNTKAIHRGALFPLLGEGKHIICQRLSCTVPSHRVTLFCKPSSRRASSTQPRLSVKSQRNGAYKRMVAVPGFWQCSPPVRPAFSKNIPHKAHPGQSFTPESVSLYPTTLRVALFSCSNAGPSLNGSA